NVFLRYRPELPTVLNGLSLEIRSREKIGICGRTGAGKSSVLNLLLRIVEAESGCVKVDGLDIKTLGLHRLRHSITVIPQDPVLFSGTLRFNLDPLNKAADGGQYWQALQRSHLSDHVARLERENAEDEGGRSNGLEVFVQEQGKNFSLGQRQQMCLARALMRSNLILLLDEATSAVDRETDDLIQQTIKEEFADHTVLCIAHRISTIMNSDRVCVLDAGKLAEIGAPADLMQAKDSRFAQLAALDAA
ncbi:ATP-binding cassette sub-family C member 2 (Canalicular multidrug resistance protein) (Canalicular multispecific organic anion transporter 1) (Multidrug resistance-associated protein 2), partial [Durusdinium trenchii]